MRAMGHGIITHYLLVVAVPPLVVLRALSDPSRPLPAQREAFTAEPAWFTRIGTQFSSCFKERIKCIISGHFLYCLRPQCMWWLLECSPERATVLLPMAARVIVPIRQRYRLA